MDYIETKYNKKEAFNPKKRTQKLEMIMLGIKTRKAYRKYIKKEEKMKGDKNEH